MYKYIVAILLSFALAFPSYCEDKKPESVKVVKMEEIKQQLIGLDKEFKPGDFIKIKISPLPTSSNPFTAVYKIALLENGKISDNCEVITKTQKSGDPIITGSDFTFSARNNGLKYQVLFGCTYIEYKPGTNEVTSIYNPDAIIYDVKIAGNIIPPLPTDVPEGTFGLIRSVYVEAIKLPVATEKKATLFTNLSNAFAGMSSKVAAGVYKDTENETDQTKNLSDFLKETKVIVNKAITDSDVDIKIFNSSIDTVVKTALEKAYDGGKMRKFVDYQGAWAEVAEAFRLALKSQQ